NRILGEFICSPAGLDRTSSLISEDANKGAIRAVEENLHCNAALSMERVIKIPWKSRTGVSHKPVARSWVTLDLNVATSVVSTVYRKTVSDINRSCSSGLCNPSILHEHFLFWGACSSRSN